MPTPTADDVDVVTGFLGHLSRARSLQLRREDELAEAQTLLYRLLEFGSESRYFTERSVKEAVTTLTKNPMEHEIVRRSVEIVLWMIQTVSQAARARLHFLGSRGGPSTVASSPAASAGDEDSGGDCEEDSASQGEGVPAAESEPVSLEGEGKVTVTRLQFLERQLTELKALMAANQAAESQGPPVDDSVVVVSIKPVAAPAPRPVSRPVALSGGGGGGFGCGAAPPPPPPPRGGKAPVAPTAMAAAGAELPPLPRPNMVSILAEASTLQLRKVSRGAEAPRGTADGAATPRRDAVPLRSSRPDMVSLVEQASKVKLRRVSVTRRARGGGGSGLQGMLLRAALEKRFKNVRRLSSPMSEVSVAGDSDDENDENAAPTHS